MPLYSVASLLIFLHECSSGPFFGRNNFCKEWINSSSLPLCSSVEFINNQDSRSLPVVQIVVTSILVASQQLNYSYLIFSIHIQNFINSFWTHTQPLDLLLHPISPQVSSPSDQSDEQKTLNHPFQLDSICGWRIPAGWTFLSHPGGSHSFSSWLPLWLKSCCWLPGLEKSVTDSSPFFLSESGNPSSDWDYSFLPTSFMLLPAFLPFERWKYGFEQWFAFRKAKMNRFISKSISCWFECILIAIRQINCYCRA